MKVVYVAGPYRSDTEYGTVLNIRQAEEIAIVIWQKGCVAFCPHKNAAFFGGLCPDEIWLKGGLEMLKRCDEMVLVEGWRDSHGTISEIQFAHDHNIPVYYSLNDWMEVNEKEGKD